FSISSCLNLLSPFQIVTACIGTETTSLTMFVSMSPCNSILVLRSRRDRRSEPLLESSSLPPACRLPSSSRCWQFDKLCRGICDRRRRRPLPSHCRRLSRLRRRSHLRRCAPPYGRDRPRASLPCRQIVPSP